MYPISREALTVPFSSDADHSGTFQERRRDTPLIF